MDKKVKETVVINIPFRGLGQYIQHLNLFHIAFGSIRGITSSLSRNK
jgi:hypothetical protein